MLILYRSYLDNCTIGKMFYKGDFVCYTLERPWLNNEKSISCVPEGVYQISPYNSSKFKDCFYLTNHNLGVGMTDDYQRNFILIHPGNFPNDIKGCIAPGMALHPSTWGVASSRVAMKKVRDLIYSNKIKKLKITR